MGVLIEIINLNKRIIQGYSKEKSVWDYEFHNSIHQLSWDLSTSNNGLLDYNSTSNKNEQTKTRPFVTINKSNQA